MTDPAEGWPIEDAEPEQMPEHAGEDLGDDLDDQGEPEYRDTSGSNEPHDE
jgi:hypothetical protein